MAIDWTSLGMTLIQLSLGFAQGAVAVQIISLFVRLPNNQLQRWFLHGTKWVQISLWVFSAAGFVESIVFLLLALFVHSQSHPLIVLTISAVIAIALFVLRELQRTAYAWLELLVGGTLIWASAQKEDQNVAVHIMGLMTGVYFCVRALDNLKIAYKINLRVLLRLAGRSKTGNGARGPAKSPAARRSKRRTPFYPSPREG